MKREELKERVEKYCIDNPIVLYYDFRDKLEVEDIKLLMKEDGLFELEETLFELNVDYLAELEEDAVNDMIKDLEIPEELEEEARELFAEYKMLDLNTKQLLENTNVVVRIEINSNYEGISYMENPEESEYLKEILPLISHAIDKEELEREIINNSGNASVFTAVFSTSADNLVGLDKLIKEGKNIIIPHNAIFGLFDSFTGSGSIMEINLKENLKLPIQWGQTEYDKITIKIDDDDKYGFQSVFGSYVNVEADFGIE